MKLCERCQARFKGNPESCPLDGAPLVPLPDPLIGQTIGGRYVVVEMVGSGGMGTVYRARHDVLARDVAIKFLSPELAHDETNRKRFLREARAANRINHEHIIDITDYGETDDGYVYLVMEYLDGTPLDRVVAQGPMTPERALEVGLQTAQALGRAHELDVVHRDVKPENIYLLRGYDGDFVKILDFGLAHMKGELRLTATGAVFGTPEYIAPEQARGQEASSSADLYALGCVLFEMLTATPPFQGASTELILKHMRDPPPAPSDHAEELPQGLDELVLGLLEKDPGDRPGNAYEVAERIKRLLDEHTPGRHRSERPPAAAPAASAPAEPTDPAAALFDGDTGDRSYTLDVEDAWQQRVATFRSLLRRAHPDGDEPEWLPEAIESLESQVRELRTVRAQLDRRASEAARQEDEVRNMRMRIGHAIDELARDEAKVSSRLGEIAERIREATQTCDQVVGPLLGLWRTIPPPPPSDRDLDREKLQPLRSAGELAGRWLDAQRTLADLEPEREKCEAQRQDLRFQLTQLKGRLASISAESDYDVGGLKEETVRLDRELQQRIERLVHDAEPVARYYLEFPELRDSVLGADAAPAGR